MRKKQIMVIGATGSGKSSLVRALEEQEGPVRKTSMPVYGPHTIDCPGAYAENTYMYRHLIALAQDICCVLLVIDAANRMDIYSPGFVQALGRPAAGVITKLDLAPENEEDCRKALRWAGVKGPVFCVNALAGTGVEELKAYLFRMGYREAR